MSTNKWWNTFYDEWNSYLSKQPPLHSNKQCVDDCLHTANVAFILRLYSTWNNLKQTEYNKKVQYLSDKIKQRSHKKGVWLYYLHKAYVHTEMHEYQEAIRDLFNGCIQHNTNQDTVWALYGILHYCINKENQAQEFLQRGDERCPGSSVINLLLDKVSADKKLCVSDIEHLNMILCTDDNEERVDYKEDNDPLMNNVMTMIANRDGIPIIYFVLRVLYNIIESPTNNKLRQLNITEIKQRTNPYGDVAINILKQCGFEWISHNDKEFLLLRPSSDALEVKYISYFGDAMNKALLNIPILDLMEGLCEFKIEDIMSDYHHICLHHTNTVKNTLEILSYFEAQNSICKASDCCILRRMYRNLEEDASCFMRKHNYGSTESPYIVLMQLLDEAHAFIYHSVSLYQYQHFAQNGLSLYMNRLGAMFCFDSMLGDDEDEHEYDEYKYEDYKTDANKYTQIIESFKQTIPKHHAIFLNSKFMNKPLDNNINIIIQPKYKNLKQEILSKISIFEWHDSDNRCCNLCKSFYCRSLLFEFDHLMVLFLWSKYHELQSKYHGMYHFVHLLDESVSIYGSEMDSNIIYHCFDNNVLFNEAQMNISIPYSFTSNFAFAEMSLDDGIIVAFSYYHHDFMPSKYFNLMWISPFCAESEIITYGAKLIMLNIMGINVISMEQYTMSNLLFFYIWNGNNISDLCLMQFENEINQCLLNLIETFMRKNINYHETGSYQQLLFNEMIKHLIKTKKPIFIDEIQNRYCDERLIKYILCIRQHNIPLYKYTQKVCKIQKHNIQSFTDSIKVPIYLNNNIYYITFILKIINNKNNVLWFMKIEEFPINILFNLCFRWKLDIASFNINIDSTLNVDRNWKGIDSSHFLLCSKDKPNKNKIDTVSLTLSIACSSYTLKSNNYAQINQDPTL